MSEAKACKKQCWCIDVGLFLLRLGVGAAFIFHGLPKLLGGVEEWEKLGTMGLSPFGYGSFYPVVWGFLAAFAECAGGLALMAGLLTRLFAFMLLCTMVAASAVHVNGFVQESSPAKPAGEWNAYEFITNGRDIEFLSCLKPTAQPGEWPATFVSTRPGSATPPATAQPPQETTRPAVAKGEQIEAPQYSYKHGFPVSSHPIKLAVVFLGLLFTGAGRIRVGRLLKGTKSDEDEGGEDGEDDTKTAMKPAGAVKPAEPKRSGFQGAGGNKPGS
jgi:uncharacterized membrane protein YphA (DoxX/SURF4 family)